MRPELPGFVGRGAGIPAAVDDAVADAVLAWRHAGAQVCGRRAVIARESLEFVLVAVDICGNHAKVVGKILHLGAIDEFLTFEDAA